MPPATTIAARRPPGLELSARQLCMNLGGLDARASAGRSGSLLLAALGVDLLLIISLVLRG